MCKIKGMVSNKCRSLRGKELRSRTANISNRNLGLIQGPFLQGLATALDSGFFTTLLAKILLVGRISESILTKMA